jgi:flagellar hook-length control protein FliK
MESCFMQINLPFELPNPTDGSPAKAEKTIDNGSGTGFPSLMEQLLTLTGINERGTKGEKSADISRHNVESFMKLFAGPGLPATQPLNLEIALRKDAGDRQPLPVLEVTGVKKMEDGDLSQNSYTTMDAIPVGQTNGEALLVAINPGKILTASMEEMSSQQRFSDPVQHAHRLKVADAAMNVQAELAGFWEKSPLFELDTPEDPGGLNTERETSANSSVERWQTDDRELQKIVLSGNSRKASPVSRELLWQGVQISGQAFLKPSEEWLPEIAVKETSPESSVEPASATASKDSIFAGNLQASEVFDVQRKGIHAAVSDGAAGEQQAIQGKKSASGLRTDRLTKTQLAVRQNDNVFPRNLPKPDSSHPKSDYLQITLSNRPEKTNQAIKDNQGSTGSPLDSHSRHASIALPGQPAGDLGEKQPEFRFLQIRSTGNHSSASTSATANHLHIVSSNSTVLSGSEQVLPAQSKDLIYQIAERIQFQLREGRGEIRIQLKPDSLGRVEIKAETTTNGVVVRIVTEAGNIKSYLESNLQLLHQNLQDQGLKVDRIYISIQNGSDSQSASGHAAQFGNSGAGGSPKEPNKPSVPSSATSMEPSEDLFEDFTTSISPNPNVRFHTIA